MAKIVSVDLGNIGHFFLLLNRPYVDLLREGEGSSVLSSSGEERPIAHRSMLRIPKESVERGSTLSFGSSSYGLGMEDLIKFKP